ncbi:hypothetical protein CAUPRSCDRAFT_11187 [Caulochytrium protostelioides]|uniref:Uncharacterized protein n=1 Tax=Caulochytrium protostelioides TaxID=1555241 RepID=A0A4P9WXQ2_9FUNG|nr:hypothetical protein CAUPRSCDRAFT_11187 [Caulochytrium protostelioides]
MPVQEQGRLWLEHRSLTHMMRHLSPAASDRYRSGLHTLPLPEVERGLAWLTPRASYAVFGMPRSSSSCRKRLGRTLPLSEAAFRANGHGDVVTALSVRPRPKTGMRVCASATVRRFPPLVWKAKRRGGASTVLARNLQPSCSANLDVSATEVFSPSFVSTVRSHGGVSLAQCMCQRKVRPTHGIEGERPKWCIQCPDKPPEAIAVHAPKCECEHEVYPTLRLTGDRLRWCKDCPGKDPKAMYLAGVRCECPRQVHATFGMPCLVSGCGGVPSVPDDFPDCTTRRQLDANASDPSNPCMASPKIRAPIGAPSASHTVRSTSSPCDVIVRGIIEFRTATQGNGLVGAPNAPIALQRRSTSTATCANVIRRTEPPLGTQASVLAGARNAPTGRPVRRTPGLRNVSVNAEWFPPSASLASAGAGVHNVRCDPPRLRTRTVLFASARVVPMPLTDILEAAGCGAANARPGLPTQRLSPTKSVATYGRPDGPPEWCNFCPDKLAKFVNVRAALCACEREVRATWGYADKEKDHRGREGGEDSGIAEAGPGVSRVPAELLAVLVTRAEPAIAAVAVRERLDVAGAARAREGPEVSVARLTGRRVHRHHPGRLTVKLDDCSWIVGAAGMRLLKIPDQDP